MPARRPGPGSRSPSRRSRARRRWPGPAGASRRGPGACASPRRAPRRARGPAPSSATVELDPVGRDASRGSGPPSPPEWRTALPTASRGDPVHRQLDLGGRPPIRAEARVVDDVGGHRERARGRLLGEVVERRRQAEVVEDRRAQLGGDVAQVAGERPQVLALGLGAGHDLEPADDRRRAPGAARRGARARAGPRSASAASAAAASRTSPNSASSIGSPKRRRVDGRKAITADEHRADDERRHAECVDEHEADGSKGRDDARRRTAAAASRRSPRRAGSGRPHGPRAARGRPRTRSGPGRPRARPRLAFH